MQEEYINSLEGGLFSDNDPAIQPKGTYRRGHNGNLVTKGQNFFSYESLDGTAVNFSLPLHKIDSGRFIPNGWFRIGNNRLVVHSTDDRSDVGGDGEIGIVTFNNSGTGTYRALYYHEEMKYTQQKMISGYALEENDAYHRHYWTDNFNQPRSINSAAGTLTTDIASGDIVAGEQYMVLTDSVGSITYDGVTYGPKQTAKNIFTATATTTYTINGSARVIKYLEVNILNYTPERTMGEINYVKQTSGGALKCGVKLYAYQLVTKDGYETAWSYTTNPIHVGPVNGTGSYQTYEGGGYSGLVNSGKSNELLISNIPSGFYKIKVAVIEMDQAYDTIRNTEVFYYDVISGTSMTITHKGQENLLPVTLDDLALRTAVIVRCKDLTTLKQRQVMVNLTERQEITWNPHLTATATHFLYTIPADKHGLQPNDGDWQTYINSSSGLTTGQILPGGHYVVRGGTKIVYNTVNYFPDETFIGVSGATGFTSVGGSIVKGCIRIKQYDKVGGGQVYKIIDLENEYFDYKSAATQANLRGYWRYETYRIGALAWDKFGNPYAVRFVADVTMPSHAGANRLINNNNPHFSFNAMGISISGIDITDIIDNISAISLVRVKRDPTVLAQGLVMQTVEKNGETNVAVPIASFVPAYDANAVSHPGTLGYTWTLFGPELDFGLSDFDILLNSGDKLKPVADIEPLNSGGMAMAISGVDQQVYSKYYITNDYTGGEAGIALVHTLETDETYSYTSGGTPFTFKNHDIKASDNHGDALGAGASGGMQKKEAAGGRRTLIVTDTADFPNPANSYVGTGVSWGSAGVNNRKLLANYCRPKDASALYGGTSEAAKANNEYMLCGHYLRITAEVLADIYDAGTGKYILNGMELWGGDCFVQMYSRVSSQYDEAYEDNDGSYSWGIIFPVESCINTGIREGRTWTKDGMHNNSNGVYFAFGATRKDEDFRYNPAYSSMNDKLLYAPLPIDFYSVGRFPYMARYSEIKFLGETVDNMRRFLVNNFKNVDAMHGEINNCRVGAQDRLMYWQDKGFGYLPVNERETTVGALGGAVQLGVSGVMERYDTLDKYFGNQHQFGLIDLEDGWCWFDMRRKAFILASYSGQAVDASIIKGMEQYFNNAFTEIETSGTENIFDTDQPLMGAGIIGVYDNEETVFMTFKMFFRTGGVKTIRDFTVLFNTKLKAFIGTSDINPGIAIEHNGRVLMSKEQAYEIDDNTIYTVGSTVSQDGINYVCYLQYTSASPAIQPLTDTTHWKVANNGNEVHEAGKGDVCKFFGVVYPYELQVSANPNAKDEKAYDVVEMYGNDTRITDVYYETSKQTAQDINIRTKDKNFEYVDNSWWFNVALKNNKERLLDHYLLIKVRVKNYLTDPTISLNVKKRIVYLKTFYRRK